MPEPPGLVVKNGTNRLAVFDKPGPFVVDPDLEPRRVCAASRRVTRAAADFEAGIGGVAQQVDQQLLELIGVGVDGDVGAGPRPGPARASRGRRRAAAAASARRARACGAGRRASRA